jgi:phosphoglycerol transferase
MAAADRDAAAEIHRLRPVAALFAIVLAILLIRNLALGSPVMPGDEYAYFSAGQTFPNPAARFESDPYLPRVYSPVFAAYTSLFFALSNRPEIPLKLFNTILFGLSVLLSVRLLNAIREPGTSRTAPVVFLLLPTSAYTAYFMPESAYALLFMLLSVCLVVLVPARAVMGAAACGAVVGAMLLVKPHAVALVVAVTFALASLLVAPAPLRPERRQAVAALAAFIVAAYAVMVCLNGVLTGTVRLHPLLFVGEIYQPYLAQGVSLATWLGRVRQMVVILGGHVIVFCALLALPLSTGAALLSSLYRGRSGVSPGEVLRERRLFLLICFAGSVAASTLAMTTNFTASAAQTLPTEHLRIHGRYYSFIFPLFLVLYFAAVDRVARRGWPIRSGAAVGCIAATLLVWLQSKRIINPYDYPEAFAFSAWHGGPRGAVADALLSYTAIAAAFAGYAFILWRGRRAAVAYPALLVTVFAISSVSVTAWQRAVSNDTATLRDDARALDDMIRPDEQDRGLVVGSEWNGPIAYFMFNFGSSARVLVSPPDASIPASALPAEARWVVLLGGYHVTFPAGESVRTPRVRLLRIDERAHATESR